MQSRWAPVVLRKGARKHSPESSRVTAPPRQTATEKLLLYVADNPVKLLSLSVLSFGGLVLLIYFTRIAFLPDVNLESAGSLLYAVALLGSLVLGYAAVTMVLPGLMLAHANDSMSRSPAPDVVLATFLGTSAWGAILAAWFLELSTRVAVSLLLALWLIAALLLVTLAIRTKRCNGESADRHLDWRVTLHQLDLKARLLPIGLRAVACFLLFAAPLLFVFAFGVYGDIRYRDHWTVLAGLLLLLLALATATAVLGTAKSQGRNRMAAAMAFGLLLVVLLVTGSFSALSVIVVRKLGLGEYDMVRAVVSGKTCRQINLALGQAVCREVADDQPSAICPTVLRSRMGSQVILEFAAMSLDVQNDVASLRWQSLRPEPDKPVSFRRVVLEKPQLLTWSNVPSTVLPAPAASATSAAVLASWLTGGNPTNGVADQPPALSAALGQVCELVPRMPEAAASAAVPSSAPGLSGSTP